VSDPSGARIAGAQVKLLDPSTNTVKTLLSNSTGRYDFFNVNPGVYDVIVSSAGFSESGLDVDPSN